MADINNSIIKKFVNIEFTDEDGYKSRWIWQLPDYLLGAVKEGSIVAVRHEDVIKTGEVVELAATTKFRPDQVGTVVDVIDIDRFDAYVNAGLRRSQLLDEMEAQAALAQKIEIYRKLAEYDPAMAELLKEYLGDDAGDSEEVRQE